MKNYTKSILVAVASVLVVSTAVYAANSWKNGFDQPLGSGTDNALQISGTANVNSGGVQNVKSGGSLLVKDGATFKIGTTGTAIANRYEGCDTTSEAQAGAWSSRSTSTSTKEDITVTGAAAGDACMVALGATAAGTKQALAWNCEVSGANTATLHVTNASGGSLTPTTGKRCVRTFSP